MTMSLPERYDLRQKTLIRELGHRVVAVGEREELAASLRHAVVASSGSALAGVVQHADARVDGRIGLDECDGSVRGPVVDHEHFKASLRLAENRFDCQADPVLDFECRDDDAEARGLWRRNAEILHTRLLP